MYDENAKGLTQNPEEKYPPVQTYQRSVRTRSAAVNAPDTRDYILRVLCVQIVLCLVITLTVFGLYKSGAQSFQTLQESYFSLFSKDMDKAEWTAALKRFSNFVFKPQQMQETIPTASEAIVSESASDAATDSGGEDLKLATDNTSFAPFTVTGSFTVPVQYTRITSRFGYRVNPITNEFGFHTGVDLAAAHGEPIYAAFSGTVETVAESAGRGKYLILEHSGGLKTMYCHCSEILVAPGAVLKGGEVVAKVGSTGQSTGPHLHFEVHLQGVRYNPEWLL